MLTTSEMQQKLNATEESKTKEIDPKSIKTNLTEFAITPAQLQIQLRNQILESIAKRGLLPKSLRTGMPFLLSNDNDGFISLNQIYLHNRKYHQLKFAAKAAVEDSLNGIWDICLEREPNLKHNFTSGKSSEQAKSDLKRELEHRLSQVIVLIFKPQQPPKKKGTIVPISFAPKVPTRDYLAANSVFLPVFDEWRTPEPVKMEDLIAVIAPTALIEQAKQFYPNAHFIEAIESTEKQKIPIPGCECNKFFGRNGNSATVALRTADFEAAIHAVAKIPKVAELGGFGIHAVRLPTEKDIEFHLAQKSPILASAIAELEKKQNVERERLAAEKKQILEEERVKAEKFAVEQEENERKLREEKLAAERASLILEIQKKSAGMIQKIYKGHATRKTLFPLYRQYRREHMEANRALQGHNIPQLQDCAEKMRLIQARVKPLFVR